MYPEGVVLWECGWHLNEGRVTATQKGGIRSQNLSFPVRVDRAQPTQGKLPPPVLPLANTAPLARFADSPNQPDRRETLMGKMEASPRPASSEPVISRPVPRAATIASPPKRARHRPILAIVI